MHVYILASDLRFADDIDLLGSSEEELLECGVVAQLIARWIRNRMVPGSNPVTGSRVTA